MFQKTVFLTLLSTSLGLSAATSVDLYKAPLSKLNGFTRAGVVKNNSVSSSASSENHLNEVSKSRIGQQSITRYQQTYKGIPVVGAEVTVAKNAAPGLNAPNSGEVNGHLVDELQVNTVPFLTDAQVLQQAQKAYSANHTFNKINDAQVVLQIRPNQNNEFELVYLVSFKTEVKDALAWPFFIINAHNGEISKQWNNVKHYSETGAGGNEKTQQYWYGKDGMPGLEVKRSGDSCTFEDNQVRLVDLKSMEDWAGTQLTALQYPCEHNEDTLINGAYSQGNDAYYFGHTIVDMYRNWYATNALEDKNGNFIQLIMRVHFGSDFENAYWDGVSMTFGDGGQYLYPLASLDVAGHEVSHGFTQHHSDLEYQDESGALNESFSDMAGQAARAYLLESMPEFYKKSYLGANQVTWKLGETITRPPLDALRYLDYPSQDGASADCLDKELAKKSGGVCSISYQDVLSAAKANYPFSAEDQQSYIVHTASGVFNKAFYLMAKQIGIKKAFQIMINANSKYWSANTSFKTGACGVIYAANDVNQELSVIKTAFNKVGVDVSACK